MINRTEMEKRVGCKIILVKNKKYFYNFPYKKNNFFWVGWAMAHLDPIATPPLSVNIIHQNPPKCHKNNFKYTNVVKKTILLWTMTHSSHPGNRILLQHAILLLDVLQRTDKEWIHLRILQCWLDSGSDVRNNLEWVGNMSDPLLLNNNLLVRRGMSCVLCNGRMVAHNRMRNTVEPSDVPILIPPLFPRRCLSTPLCLVKDMDQKILKDHNHNLWLKSKQRRRRLGNGLDIL